MSIVSLIDCCLNQNHWLVCLFVSSAVHQETRHRYCDVDRSQAVLLESTLIAVYDLSIDRTSNINQMRLQTTIRLLINPKWYSTAVVTAAAAGRCFARWYSENRMWGLCPCRAELRRSDGQFRSKFVDHNMLSHRTTTYLPG